MTDGSGLSHAFAVPNGGGWLRGSCSGSPRRGGGGGGEGYTVASTDRQPWIRGAASRGRPRRAGGRGSSTACSASSRHLIGLMGCAVTHRLYSRKAVPAQLDRGVRCGRQGKRGAVKEPGGEEASERAGVGRRRGAERESQCEAPPLRQA